MVAVIVATSAGCLLTSDFDGIVGVRPPGDEGGVTLDGGNGGGDGGGDAATDFCSGAEHVVCTTFDHSGPPLPVPGWNHDVRAPSTLTIDQTSSVTAPGSLRARVTGTAEINAYLYRQVFIGQPKALVMSLDFRSIACPAQGNALTLAYVQVASETAFAIALLSSGVFAGGTKAGAGTDAFFPLEKQFTSAWSHVVMRVERLNATTAHLNATIDGVKALDTDAQTTAWDQMALLNIGVNGSAASKTCEVAFDNFVLDRE